jgi:hypothetical protein
MCFQTPRKTVKFSRRRSVLLFFVLEIERRIRAKPFIGLVPGKGIEPSRNFRSSGF